MDDCNYFEIMDNKIITKIFLLKFLDNINYYNIVKIEPLKFRKDIDSFYF